LTPSPVNGAARRTDDPGGCPAARRRVGGGKRAGPEKAQSVETSAGRVTVGDRALRAIAVARGNVKLQLARVSHVQFRRPVADPIAAAAAAAGAVGRRGLACEYDLVTAAREGVATGVEAGVVLGQLVGSGLQVLPALDGDVTVCAPPDRRIRPCRADFTVFDAALADADGRPGRAQAVNASRDAAGRVCATVRAPRGRAVFPVLRAPFPGEVGFGSAPPRAYFPSIFYLSVTPRATAAAAGFVSAFRRAVAAGLGPLTDDVAVEWICDAVGCVAPGAQRAGARASNAAAGVQLHTRIMAAVDASAGLMAALRGGAFKTAFTAGMRAVGYAGIVLATIAPPPVTSIVLTMALEGIAGRAALAAAAGAVRDAVAYALLPDAAVNATTEIDLDRACDPAGACSPAIATAAPACPAGWAAANCAVAFLTVRTVSASGAEARITSASFAQRVVVGFAYSPQRAGLVVTRSRLVGTSGSASPGVDVLPPDPLPAAVGSYARPPSSARVPSPAQQPLLSAAEGRVPGWPGIYALLAVVLATIAAVERI
jgi:hypothetical protein